MRYIQKGTANLLAFLCFRLCYISWSMQIREESQSKGKTSSFNQQVERLRTYEVIAPIIYKTSEFDGVAVPATVLQITAFGKVYDIVLKRENNQSFVNTYVEYIGKNNSYQAKYMYKDGCYYTGSINSLDREPLDVVLNYCDGIEGMIQSSDSLLFIEPVRDEHASSGTILQKHIVYKQNAVKLKTFDDVHEENVAQSPPINDYRARIRRTSKKNPYESFLTFINKSGRTVQLYYLDPYKAHIPFIAFVVNERRSVNTYIGTTWIAKDDTTDQLFLVNGKSEHVATKNKPYNRITVIMSKPARMVFNDIENNNILTNSVGRDKHYMEVLVVADESVVSFHGKDRIETYILTMMDIAGQVFKHKSLGVVINFQVVRIVLIDNNETGFTVYNKNPTKTLRNACNFISSLQNSEETHPDHFDFGIALSRKNFGPSGFAQLYSMCSTSRSCALVQDEGLTSAFIVAHETGHLLGLEHDGEGEARRCSSEGPRGSIMSPIIVARYNRYRWSTCSQEVLKENIEYFYCLQNTPRQIFPKMNIQNHGALYTLTDQCQFNFDKRYTTCTSFTYNPCRELWCSNSNANAYCKTMRGPALEGTICGKNEHCSKGECVKQNNIIPTIETEKEKDRIIVIRGMWSSWSTWSSCSRTCKVGIRNRRRSCDNPKPSSGGEHCKGEDFQRDVCNTKECHPKAIYNIQVENCRKKNGKSWTVYSENDLLQQGSNLNCTFESGFCNWKNDKKSNINWEVNKGRTKSSNTGPSRDHTFPNSQGKYIFVEASSTRKHTKTQGDLSRLVSNYTKIPRICFTLFYHMFGRDMGKLRIKMLHKNRSEVILWSKSGNQINKWHKAAVDFMSADRYKIVVEAVRGVHWASDIAIDDISVVPGVCDKNEARYQCKHSCRTRDANKFLMNMNMADGERCDDTRNNNICLSGECVKFGCDNKFDSDLQVDDCGICGGNGSKCIKVTGRKEIYPRKDYEVLMSLGEGLTFINLTQESSDTHYFGLNKNNHMFLNTKREEFYDMEGTTFHFIKLAGGRQVIFSRGPTYGNLDVLVYTYPYQRNRPLSMKYQYFKPTKTAFKYKYKNDGWSSCSKSCDIGRQRTLMRCLRLQDKVRVDESFCKGLEKPVYIRICRMNPCPKTYEWFVGKWKPCSRTCGTGKRTRNIRCIHIRNKAVTPKHLCPSKVPTHREICNTNKCPSFKWITQVWGTCSRSCGEGIRNRIADCVNENTGSVVNKDKCKAVKPDLVHPCILQPCEIYIYIVEKTSRCTKTCGGGLKAQIVFCVKERNMVKVANEYCTGPSPPRIVKCNEYACPEFVWKIGESSPCSTTCGNGTISRDILCVNMQTIERANKSNCRTKKIPEVVSCIQKRCISYQIKSSSWTTCTVTCGIGMQKRLITCIERFSKKTVPSYKCYKDGIRLQRRCEIACIKSNKLYCQFDSPSFCNWQNVRKDDFDWSLGKKTPSYRTGPQTDHTTRQGYFAYIETSSPRRRGDRAMLSSPYINALKGCFSFWYHMRGADMGRLRLLLTSEKTNQLLFEKRGNQGRYWLQGKLNINSDSTYRIIFEATRGSGVYSDVAIDDISFQRKKCEKIINRHNKRKREKYVSHKIIRLFS